MNKQQIENELKKYNNGAMVINQSEIKKAMHKGYKGVQELTEGLPFIKEGRTVVYPVKSVAARIFELMNAERL